MLNTIFQNMYYFGAVYLAQYWPLLAVGLVVVFLWLNIHNTAVRRVLGLMLRAEKQAEAAGLVNGPEMFAWSVMATYNLIPPWVRWIITISRFERFCQGLYDKAKAEGDAILAEQAETPPA